MLAERASARETPSVLCAAEAVLLVDALTAVVLQRAVQVMAGKVLASGVLLAAGIMEPLPSESLAGGSRLRFFEVDSDEAGTVRNVRLACTAKKNVQLTAARKKRERWKKE